MRTSAFFSLANPRYLLILALLSAASRGRLPQPRLPAVLAFHHAYKAANTLWVLVDRVMSREAVLMPLLSPQEKPDAGLGTF